MSEDTKVNNDFGIPDAQPNYVPDLQPKFEGGAVDAATLAMSEPTKTAAAIAAVAGTESASDRESRLQLLAQVEINKERDAEDVAAIVAAERARRAQELLPIDTSGWPADYDKIRIYRGQNKQDKGYVELSINGFCIKAPRDREIILPHIFVTECLDHAVEEITIQSQGGLITQPSHRFPYQFIAKASSAEYAAFQIQERALAERQLSTVRMSA